MDCVPLTSLVCFSVLAGKAGWLWSLYCSEQVLPSHPRYIPIARVSLKGLLSVPTAVLPILASLPALDSRVST